MPIIFFYLDSQRVRPNTNCVKYNVLLCSENDAIPTKEIACNGGEAVVAARHGEAVVRAGVRGRERLVDMCGILVLLAVAVMSCAPVLPRPRHWVSVPGLCMSEATSDDGGPRRNIWPRGLSLLCVWAASQGV
jgi:hypothetical protein